MKFRCENCGKTFSKDIKSTAADFWFRKHPRCPHCGSYCTEKI
ncbi:MAG: hydrogenase maturation nickel metallochaperone HypA [Aigarchaeota archaeon]|nr:hydrogenase maturation nickel metallochaperone HypA [Aigarchaeota archaeon]